MPIGLKFKDLVTTSDIDNLLGVAENPDGITPGNKFTYSKTPNISAPSDAIVLTEKATLATSVYTNAGLTTTAVGGIPAGSNFYNTPKSFDDFVLAAQFAFINPAFTSFNISGISIVEVGYKITGSHNFQWTISNPQNAQPNTITIEDLTNALTLVSNHSLTSPAPYNFSLYAGGGLEVDTASNVTFLIQMFIVGDGTTAINYLVHWEWRVHSGMCIANTGSITNAQILALANSSLTTTFPPQVTTASGGYFHYLIPTTFVQPSIFKDHSTGFSIDMNAPVVISVTNANGIVQNYNDYQSTNILLNTVTVDIT